ncbi:hypothetical protein DICPUDRAFT_159694, partial [Dictyostelium purpureum]
LKMDLKEFENCCTQYRNSDQYDFITICMSLKSAKDFLNDFKSQEYLASCNRKNIYRGFVAMEIILEYCQNFKNLYYVNQFLKELEQPFGSMNKKQEMIEGLECAIKIFDDDLSLFKEKLKNYEIKSMYHAMLILINKERSVIPELAEIFRANKVEAWSIGRSNDILKINCWGPLEQSDFYEQTNLLLKKKGYSIDNLLFKMIFNYESFNNFRNYDCFA